jgi:hypothetical protein
MEPIQRKKPWYSRCYDSIVHWIEDTYLKLFGENRTSYGVKNTLRKTEVTGNKDVDRVQRGAGELAGNTFKTDRVGGPVGDAVDKKVLRGNV